MPSSSRGCCGRGSPAVRTGWVRRLIRVQWCSFVVRMKTPRELPNPGSIARLNEIAGAEVDLAFGAARFQEKAIGSVRFKQARTGVGHPWTHPRNALAV